MNNVLDEKVKDKFIEELRINLNIIRNGMQVFEDHVIFPLNAAYCYFCILNKNNCVKCEYQKIYGTCFASEWEKIKKLSEEIDTSKFSKYKLIKIYEVFINKIIDSKNVNELMNEKKEMLIEIFKLFDNSKNRTIIKEIIERVKTYYWNEETNKWFEDPDIFVKDLNEMAKRKALYYGFNLDNKLTIPKPSFIKIGQRVKVGKITYVLTIIGHGRVGLISEDFMIRYSDLNEDVIFYQDNTTDFKTSIRLEDFEKFFENNNKYELVETK